MPNLKLGIAAITAMNVAAKNIKTVFKGSDKIWPNLPEFNHDWVSPTYIEISGNSTSNYTYLNISDGVYAYSEFEGNTEYKNYSYLMVAHPSTGRLIPIIKGQGGGAGWDDPEYPPEITLSGSALRTVYGCYFTVVQSNEELTLGKETDAMLYNVAMSTVQTHPTGFAYYNALHTSDNSLQYFFSLAYNRNDINDISLYYTNKSSLETINSMSISDVYNSQPIIKSIKFNSVNSGQLFCYRYVAPYAPVFRLLDFFSDWGTFPNAIKNSVGTNINLNATGKANIGNVSDEFFVKASSKEYEGSYNRQGRIDSALNVTGSGTIAAGSSGQTVYLTFITNRSNSYNLELLPKDYDYSNIKVFDENVSSFILVSLS